MQIGPYTYVTAAHVVVGAGNIPFRGIQIFPAYKLPGITGGVPVTVVRDLGYVYSVNQLRGHDLAILQVERRNSNTPAQIVAINETVDKVGASAYCAASPNASGDPFWMSSTLSLYNATGPAGSQSGGNGCLSAGPAREIISYPQNVVWPNLCLNTTNNDLPYLATGVSIFGDSSKELIHNTADGAPISGMHNAYVSRGSSGGGLFARPPGTDQSHGLLLGIITAASGTNGYAAGQFNYNLTGIWSAENIAYQPSSLINISSPIDGNSYDSSAVPNLVADAGSSTSQLHWKSDIDGDLGTGGNVNVAGRLSAGYHTITATLGSSTAGGNTTTSTTVLRRLHIQVTGTPTPAFTISPSTVQIPATQTYGFFTYTWRDTAYASLDVQGRINGGTWLTPVQLPSNVGSTTDRLKIADRYDYRFFPHANTTTVLGSLTVNGVAAPAPVFGASPMHISTNSSTGTSHITWSAPGYGLIDWCGSVDLGVTWICNVTSPDGGGIDVTLPVGATWMYRFYPQGQSDNGSTVHMIGHLTIDCVGTGAPSFSADPTHVIVPAGGTQGNTIITWYAPAYSLLDWCGQVNNGGWSYGVTSQNAGSTTQPVPLGSTYGYRFYPHGQYGSCATANLLGEVTVISSH